jgi:hypothetical protein
MTKESEFGPYGRVVLGVSCSSASLPMVVVT